MVLSTLLLVLNGFKMYPTQRDYFKTVARLEKTEIGTDKELEDVIEYLETRLEDRSHYDFSLENEPLRLQNVLFMYDSQGRMLKFKDKGKVRVTAVFIGGKRPQALINFKNMNYTVTVGDSLDGGEIVYIDEEEVVFSKDKKEIHYPVIEPTE